MSDRTSTRDAMRAKMAGTPRNMRGMKMWFNVNTEAFEALSVWMEMRLLKETDWTLGRILQELREQYGFPYPVTSGNFGARLRLDYPEQYPLQDK